ncbi:MAG: glycoside hydrolase family 2, partial [Clostridiales bacterium]|nr:glycoside hydrolase family 2 [Clostridiales bacterium]
MEKFNCGWEFMMEGAVDWQPVTLPHDWLIKDARNLYKDGVGCYRKKFLPDEFKNGERIFLRFDGVYQDSCVYVNGAKAGEWKNGYTAFSHEITEFLKAGENEILMKVNYESPNTRWYSGAGIYRDCWLVRKNAAHFKQDGIYVSTRKSDGGTWRVEIDAEVESAGQEYEVRHSIGTEVENPRLWDIESPELYELTSELTVSGQVVDTVVT